jgi:hypothetical protein
MNTLDEKLPPHPWWDHPNRYEPADHAWRCCGEWWGWRERIVRFVELLDDRTHGCQSPLDTSALAVGPDTRESVMSERFEVGEVAITQHYLTLRYNGLEVIVIGLPEWSKSRYKGGEICPETLLYPVQWPDGDKTWEPFWKLRKRRPPQDWITLCHLDEVGELA